MSSGNVENAIGASVQNVKRTAGEVCLGSVPDVGYLHNRQPAVTSLTAAQSITTGRIPQTAARALIVVMKAVQSDVVIATSTR